MLRRLGGPFVNFALLSCSGQAKNKPRAEILSESRDLKPEADLSGPPAIRESFHDVLDHHWHEEISAAAMATDAMAAAQTPATRNKPATKLMLSQSSSSAVATVHIANNPIMPPNNVRIAMVSKEQAVAHAGIDALQLQNEPATAIKTPTITKADNAQVAAALKLIFVTRVFQGPPGAQRCQLIAKTAELAAKPVRMPSVIVRFRIATQSQPLMDFLLLRVLLPLVAALSLSACQLRGGLYAKPHPPATPTKKTGVGRRPADFFMQGGGLYAG
jgi:hypothetical protein